MPGLNKFSPCCDCSCTTNLCLTGYVFDHNALTSGVKYDPNIAPDYVGVHKTNGSKIINYAVYNSSGVYVASAFTGASGANQSPLYTCLNIPNNTFPIVSGTNPVQYATSGFFYTQPLGCHVPTGTPFDCGYIDGYAYTFLSGNKIPVANIGFSAYIGGIVQATAVSDSNGHARLSGILTQTISPYTVKASGTNYPAETLSLSNFYCNAVVNFYSGVRTPDYLLTCSTGNYYGRYLTQCSQNSGVLEANFDCSPVNCFSCGLLAPIGNESGTSILKDPIFMGTPWGTITLPFTTNVAPFGNTWSAVVKLPVTPVNCIAASGFPSCPTICPTSSQSTTNNIPSPLIASGTFTVVLSCISTSGGAALSLDMTLPSKSHSSSTNPNPDTCQFAVAGACSPGVLGGLQRFATPNARQAPTISSDTPDGFVGDYPCYDNYGLCSITGTCFDGFGSPHQCIQKVAVANDAYAVFALGNRCKIRRASKLINCESEIISPLDITMTVSTEYDPSTMQTCCSGFSPSSFTVTFTD